LLLLSLALAVQSKATKNNVLKKLPVPAGEHMRLRPLTASLELHTVLGAIPLQLQWLQYLQYLPHATWQQERVPAALQ
jgi:hypothetical protein